MSGRIDSSRQVVSHGALRRASRLECRECHVICESVVSPWRCLRAKHTCVYAFDDDEGSYFGCLHKVFQPELDLRAFEDSDSTSAGRSDPYGPVRVVRSPRAQCPVSVERAYSPGTAAETCVNPGFLREVFRACAGADSMDAGGGTPRDYPPTSGQ
jgi:hypothetical protein